MSEIYDYVKEICTDAKYASRVFSQLNTEVRNLILSFAADIMTERISDIIEANKLDCKNAVENGISAGMLDRLKLDEKRIKGIIQSIRDVIALDDPIGHGEHFVRPNGLVINKVKVPLGVVAMIYEARPNVTADAAALCIKSGNCCVLRCGKEAINSSRAIVGCFKSALEKIGSDTGVVSFIDSTSREGTNALMEMRGLVNLLIPRGGKGLIKAVVENAKVPVIETGAGNCHLYIDEYADMYKAIPIALNAKLSRVSVCNAVETILVHKAVAKEFLTEFYSHCKGKLEIFGDEATQSIIECSPATDEDYATEYDDYKVAIRVVDSIETAIDHIAKYSTGHSESIVTENYTNAKEFQNSIDSAVVYVNASTRFTDGGCFGFGAEIGISTQKLHARGPMALNELTTVKYLVDGDGQIRELI